VVSFKTDLTSGLQPLSVSTLCLELPRFSVQGDPFKTTDVGLARADC